MTTAIEEEGAIDVLNVGLGHLKLSYNAKDPIERDRAKRMIEQMFQRGYALFVEIKKGDFRRVERFDPKHDTYILGDVPAGSEADVALAAPPPELCRCGRPAGHRGPHLKDKRAVPATKARATAVGRTAGG